MRTNCVFFSFLIPVSQIDMQIYIHWVAKVQMILHADSEEKTLIRLSGGTG